MHQADRVVFSGRLLNLYCGLIPALCIWCYLYYPAWRNIAALRNTPAASVYLAAFIVALLLIIKLAVVVSAGDRKLHTNLSAPNADSLSSIASRWPVLALGVLITLFVVGQLQFISQPVLTGPDESGHLLRKLRQWNLFVRDGNLYPMVAFALACLSSALCFACFAIPIRGANRKELTGNLFLVLLLFVVLIGLTEVVQMIHRGWGMDYRFPPFRSITIQPAILIFGATEFPVRIISTVFGALTAIVVYKTLDDEGQPAAGFVAAAICLTCPVFFLYSHLDYRDVGGAFFVALCIYFLLKYLRTWNPVYLSISCFTVAAGYLERRPVAIALLICGLVVLTELVMRWRQRQEPSDMTINAIVRLLFSRGLFLLSTVVAVAPWIYITREMRPYTFHPENFLELKFLLAYFKVLTSMLVWPVLVMLVVGTVVMIVKRNRVGILALLACIVFYVLFTGDKPKWIPTRRFVLNFLPCIALIAALSITYLSSARKRGIVAILCIVPMLIGVVGWSMGSHPLLLDKRARTPQTLPLFPFDKLVDSVVAEGLRNPRFCFPKPAYQRSLRVYWEIIYPNDRLKTIQPLKKDQKPRPTLESLQKLCTKENTDYLVLMFRQIGAQPFKPYRVSGVTNAQVEANTIDGFDVVYVHQNGRNKLAALKPR